MNNEKIDGYLRFFDYFNINEDRFLDFAHENIILIDKDKASSEWENIKKNILNEKKCLLVRSFGRNGQSNYLYEGFYKEFFIADIQIDSSNNSEPTKVLEKLTQLKKNSNLHNYQASHIFGLTKNPYAFCAPWNIAFIPKILDPFTGHESKGELTSKITKLYRDLMWEKYNDLILDYNTLMLGMKERIDVYLQQKQEQKFRKSVLSEFSEIKKDKQC